MELTLTSGSRSRTVPAVAWAVIAGLLAVAMRHHLDGVLGAFPTYLTVLPPVIVMAWWGGFWPGIVTGAIGTAGTYLLYADQPHFDAGTASGRAVVAMLVVVLCSALGHRLMRVRQAADANSGAADELALAEQHLTATLQSAPLSIFDMDLGLRFVRVINPRFGLREDDLIGKRAEDVLPAELAAQVTELRRSAIRHNRMERRVIRYDVGGEQRVFDMVVLPIRDRFKRVVGVTNTALDITERVNEQERSELLAQRTAAAQQAASACADAERALGRAAEADRAKDEFLANLSHELRTPLNASLGWARLMAQDPGASTRVRQAAEAIARSVKTQARLIDDLLDLNGILGGTLGLELQAVDVAEAMDAALAMVAPDAVSRQLELVKAFEPGLTARADRRRLEQVMANLLSNAVKFSAPGGRIVVGGDVVNGSVRVWVADEGEGIAPALLPQVFERYRQADSSANRRHGGLGLGLAIAKNLVELHGGQISAASEGEGRGARFEFTLPSAAREAVHGVASGVAPAAIQALQSLRVLVVDDDDDSLAVMGDVLSRYCRQVRLAGSAREALSLLSREPHDVLICDLAMPEMDGYALVRELGGASRAHRPERVIAITAFSRAEDRNAAIDAGFDEVLGKPIEPMALVACLASHQASGEASEARAEGLG
jgi:PAS domain S-box-containing protein